ncbi:MAG: hypothetical protein KME57_30315 [Scytonema hyalinum WJT4-NPBG1]|nr:hypothetical protein [Scytonema hyalinum WJT4-NPBG1]
MNNQSRSPYPAGLCPMPKGHATRTRKPGGTGGLSGRSAPSPLGGFGGASLLAGLRP